MIEKVHYGKDATITKHYSKYLFLNQIIALSSSQNSAF